MKRERGRKHIQRYKIAENIPTLGKEMDIQIHVVQKLQIG